MCNIKKNTAVGTECGELYRIVDRYPETVAIRKLAGSIGKTGERADRRVCGVSSYYEAEVAPGLYLGLCKKHAKAKGLVDA